MMKPLARQLRAASLALAVLAATAGVSRGQYAKPEIGELNKPVEPYQPGEVNVDEKLGSYVPLGDPFLDEDGRDVTLKGYLAENRPVILWLGYYDCPQFCDRMSAGLVRGVKDIRLDSGKEFAIVHVSINPNEVPGLAKQKKINYTKELGQPGESKGWNLLTGSPQSIASITSAVGYKYKAVKGLDGETEYAHPAVLVVLSPRGEVTRYLYPQQGGGDLAFDPETLRLSLIEASDGKVGSTLDKVMLTCLRWDAHTGKYTWVATALMKWAGGLTVLAMAAVFLPLWIRAARRPDDDGNDAAHGGTLATR